MAYIGQTLTEGTRRVYTYTATASQSTFSAVYNVGQVDVYQNGILLQPSDYTASTGTTIVLGTAAALNDEITITCHNTFSVADTVTASQGGTFSGDVVASTRLQVGDSSITNAYGNNASLGYVADFQGSTGNQTFISIAVPSASSLGDNGVIIGEDATDTYITQRGNKNIKLATQDLTRINIDGSGRVTMPYQPFIECVGSLSSTNTYSAGSVVSHWQDRTTPVGITRSGGRFTVPVSGKYYFGFTLYSYVTASGHYRIHLAINGNNHSLTQLEISSSSMIDSQYDHTVMDSHILNLSANDYVEIKVNDQQQIYRGSPHNSLSMMLLG